MNDPYEILRYPMMGEKSTGMREKENTLTFIVNQKATKKQVKEAVEKLYNVEVTSVRTINLMDGNKKAHVRLSEKHSADEVASHFGVI
ncbi:MAG: 50S ribosomal protein L23 [Candidatus Altiarchaeota archaeon]